MEPDMTFPWSDTERRAKRTLRLSGIVLFTGVLMWVTVLAYMVWDSRGAVKEEAFDEAIQRTTEEITSILARDYVKKEHYLPIVRCQQSADRARDQLIDEMQAMIRELQGDADPNILQAPAKSGARYENSWGADWAPGED